jgi:hypothetical protein
LRIRRCSQRNQGRKRGASDRKQETGADRKRVRVIAGVFGPAAGDEAVGAAERGGKDHEGADRDHEPRMAARKTAEAHPDPEFLPHVRPSRVFVFMESPLAGDDAMATLQSA